MPALPPLDQRTLTSAFRRAVEGTPDTVAHVADGRTWTFAESRDRALRLGGALHELAASGTAPVALMLDNHLDFVHVWLGVGLAGDVQVPVNTGYRGSFLAHVLNDSGATVLVVEAHYLERLLLVRDQLGALRTVVVRGLVPPMAGDLGLEVVALTDQERHRPAEAVESRPGDLVALMYTSGTTGMSKGVEITHAHAYTYASREDQARPTSDDRILVTLPMFHLAGQWYGVYQALIAGATCVVEPAFSVSRFWDVVREHRITHTVMLGAMAELLLQAPARDDDTDNPLRTAVMAPLASAPDRFARRFDVDLEPVYGMSEIGAVLGSHGTAVVPGEAGVAREEEYQLRLVRADGQEAAEGEMGELWVRPVRPELVMRGYHGLPEKTAETLVDGWVHTGDAFRLVEGHYFFADRMKDALRRRGENVSSFEVERVINQHPSVAESAVVGVPAELGEDEIMAVVVVRTGEQLDPVALTHFLVEHLPYFMVPRYVEVVDELPRTPTQKVQKHLLRAGGAASAWDREAAGITVSRTGR